VNELSIEGIGLLGLKIDRTGLRRTDDLSLKWDVGSQDFLEINSFPRSDFGTEGKSFARWHNDRLTSIRVRGELAPKSFDSRASFDYPFAGAFPFSSEVGYEWADRKLAF